MEITKIVASLLIGLVGFSAQATQQYECKKGTTKVVVTFSQDRRQATVSVQPEIEIPYNSRLVQLDPLSTKEVALYADADIVRTQKKYNSVIVFKITDEARSGFKGSLQNRDYDDDYELAMYRYDEKGPRKNGYVLRQGSFLDMPCIVK